MTKGWRQKCVTLSFDLYFATVSIINLVFLEGCISSEISHKTSKEEINARKISGSIDWFLLVTILIVCFCSGEEKWFRADVIVVCSFIMSNDKEYVIEERQNEKEVCRNKWSMNRIVGIYKQFVSRFVSFWQQMTKGRKNYSSTANVDKHHLKMNRNASSIHRQDDTN